MSPRARSERGQAFALMVIALVALLGTAALAMDVGFAWYAKRQVQASADAAALAGAQQLPDITSATSTANYYATLNTPDNLSNVDVTVTTGCTVASENNGWCDPDQPTRTSRTTRTGSRWSRPPRRRPGSPRSSGSTTST